MQSSNCSSALPKILESSCHKRQVICLLGQGCVERNVCAGILLPVGTVEKGPVHQLILFDKGPDRPRLYVSAWRRCLCLIPALKKVDLVGKRRGRACRRQFLYGCQYTPCWGRHLHPQTNTLIHLIYLTTPVPPDAINVPPTNHARGWFFYQTAFRSCFLKVLGVSVQF